MSHYPYKTAKEQYDGLLAAATAKGGPTVYAKATTSGLGRDGIPGTCNRILRPSGFGGPSLKFLQFCLYSVSIQGRMVQDNYHGALGLSTMGDSLFLWGRAERGFPLGCVVHGFVIVILNHAALDTLGAPGESQELE